MLKGIIWIRLLFNSDTIIEYCLSYILDAICQIILSVFVWMWKWLQKKSFETTSAIMLGKVNFKSNVLQFCITPLKSNYVT